MKKIFSVILSAALMLQMYIAPVKAASDIEGWSLINSGGSEFTIDSEIKYGGNYSLKLLKKLNGAASFTTPFFAEKGKNYIYGFTAKSKQTTDTAVMLDWGTRHTLTPLNASYDWTKFEFEYTHMTDSAEKVIRFTADGVTNGLWIDNVYCYEVENGVRVGENLLENGDFEKYEGDADKGMNGGELFNKYFASLDKQKYIPVFPAESIKIDGNTDDWESYSEIDVTKRHIYRKGSKTDMNFSVKFAYDDKCFYILAVTEDDVFAPAAGSSYWANDALQIGFSQKGEVFGKEIGVSYDSKTGGAYTTHPDGSEIKIVPDNGRTIYEMAFEWEMLYGEKRDDFLFSILASDNDGVDRLYVTELAPGIAEGKTNAAFPTMLIMPDHKTGFMYIDGAADGVTNEECSFDLNIVNPGAAHTVQIDIDALNFHKQLEIEAESIYKETIPYTFDTYGSVEILPENDAEIRTYGMDIFISPTEAEFEDKFEALAEHIKEIKALIKECEENDIPTDYEQIHLSTMEMFDGFIREDIGNKDTERIDYTFNALNEAYIEARDNLKGYLSGAKAPKHTSRIINNGNLEVIGNSIWGDTVTNGVEERKPVFLVGYGHGTQAAKDVQKFPNFGVNYLQNEIGISNNLRFTGTIPDWTTVLKEDGSVVEVQSEDKYSGDNALYITNSVPLTPDVWRGLFQAVEVEPYTKYKFGGKIKAKNVNSTSVFLNSYSDKYTFKTSTNGWEEFEYEFTTGPEGIRVIRIVAEGIIDELYLDDLYVKADGSEENVLINGSFENEELPEEEFSASNEYLGDITTLLQRAEESNVMVSVLLSPHYFPQFVFDKYPETVAKTPGTIHFRVDDERVREVIEVYTRSVVEIIKKYNSLSDITLTNEPCYSAMANSYYKPLWTEHLKELYGNDIQKLNEIYDSDYTSFDEIEMPDQPEKTPRNYDYVLFNNKLFADFHEWFREVVKEIAPDIPVHVKLMTGTFLTGDSKKMYNYGYNYEDFAEFTDVIGLDGGDSFKGGTFLITGFDDSSHMKIWAEYDVINSIKNAPIYNTEDHLIGDSSKDYVRDNADHVGRYIWQGAIHGRGASAIWIWQRSLTEKTIMGSILYRPDCIIEVGRSALDLNRLSKEVTSVANAERNVGILYSYASRNYKDCEQELLSLYSVNAFNGIKTKFVSDEQPEMLDENIRLLLVPNIYNVKRDMLTQIAQYQENGGKVVILGRNSLMKDERNQLHDSKLLDEIYSKAQVIDTEIDAKTQTKMIQEILLSENLVPVRLKDAHTGEEISNIEYEYNVYNGKLLLNISSYREYGTAAEISVYIGGEKVGRMKDLRSGTTYVDSVTVEPAYPVLLQINIENPFFDTYNHWAEEAVVGLYNQNLISGRTETKFSPEEELTYAEWITMLTRILEIAPEKGTGLHWSEGYVKAAQKAGFVSQNKDYDEKITRADMCSILVSAMEIVKGLNMTSESLGFSDAAVCGVAVEKAAAAGWITGFEDNTFRPYNSLTRAEAAQILSEVMKCL